VPGVDPQQPELLPAGGASVLDLSLTGGAGTELPLPRSGDGGGARDRQVGAEPQRRNGCALPGSGGENPQIDLLDRPVDEQRLKGESGV